MAITFKDVTSYSRGDVDLIPRTWEAMIAGVRLVVTRHIYFERDEWIARSCLELLTSKDVEAAKREAVELLGRRCAEIADACKKIA